MAQPNEYLECEAFEDGKVRLNQYEVSEIMMERIKEIFNLVKKQINLLTKKEISYIKELQKMLEKNTGGLTEANDFDVLVDENFGNIARIADVNEIGARNNMYSTAIGLIKFYYRKLKLRGKEFSIFTLDEQEEFSGMQQRKGSENSILGKVFGIFFDN